MLNTESEGIIQNSLEKFEIFCFDFQLKFFSYPESCSNWCYFYLTKLHKHTKNDHVKISRETRAYSFGIRLRSENTRKKSFGIFYNF